MFCFQILRSVPGENGKITTSNKAPFGGPQQILCCLEGVKKLKNLCMDYIKVEGEQAAKINFSYRKLIKKIFAISVQGFSTESSVHLQMQFYEDQSHVAAVLIQLLLGCYVGVSHSRLISNKSAFCHVQERGLLVLYVVPFCSFIHLI